MGYNLKNATNKMEKAQRKIAKFEAPDPIKG